MISKSSTLLEIEIGQYCQHEVYGLLDYISSLTPNSAEVEKLLPEIAFKSLFRSSDGERSTPFEARPSKAGYYQWHYFNYGYGAHQENYERNQQWRKFEEDAREQIRRDEDNVRREKRRKNRRQREDESQREARENEQERRERARIAEEERKQEVRRERERKAREREAQEQKAKDQAMSERREWQQAWHSYVTEWEAFKALEESEKPSTVEKVQQRVPWPTKSGQFRDLKKSNVVDFYRKAFPDADTPDKMSKMMRTESLKWHPDKARRLYHDCKPGVIDEEALKMICLVVLELKEQADAAKTRL
ncbi:hypothetical protein H2200_006854 [Cladophialophora chaetospira]|uniref:Uncharacterized protein n=1 Tax=Cladophialophora chaetospira TaxID=386627 RepID=A0AA38X903_9EURO|nr:hypothetical protein H2200_006854 [Cladophialophora chaetospira]